MISKELLNEVLGYTPSKIDSIKQVSGSGLTLVLLNEDNTVRSYQNIYELAHKCKEWAMGQEVQVNSNNSNQCIIFGIGYSFKESFSAETEPEAIFKACQWILDNKEANK